MVGIDVIVRGSGFRVASICESSGVELYACGCLEWWMSCRWGWLDDVVVFLVIVVLVGGSQVLAVRASRR